jgi:hypothetical protein
MFKSNWGEQGRMSEGEEKGLQVRLPISLDLPFPSCLVFYIKPESNEEEKVEGGGEEIAQNLRGKRKLTFRSETSRASCSCTLFNNYSLGKITGKCFLA